MLKWILAIMQVSHTTLQRHIAVISTAMSVDTFVSKRGINRIVQTSFQTDLAVAFLRRYSELHGLPCPRGRVASDVEQRRYISSGYLKKDVHDVYKNRGLHFYLVQGDIWMFLRR